MSHGDQMPRIGFGNWLLKGWEECHRAVSDALRFSYRHIDTTCGYRNEASVGQAERESSILRDELSITSKLTDEAKTYDCVRWSTNRRSPRRSSGTRLSC